MEYFDQRAYSVYKFFATYCLLPKSYEGAHFLSPLPIAAILVKHMNQYISADGQVNTPLCRCNLHTGGLLTSSLPETLSCLGSQDTALLFLSFQLLLPAHS